MSAQSTPDRGVVRPALGHKHFAEVARAAQLPSVADFIELQNAEIEHLYAALQSASIRARRASPNNKVAAAIRSAADFALRYGPGAALNKAGGERG